MDWRGRLVGFGRRRVLMVDATAGSPTNVPMAALQGLGFNRGPGVIGQGGSNQGAGVVGIASDPNSSDQFGNLRPEVLAVNAGVFGMSEGSGLSDIGVRGENVWDDTAAGHQLGDGHGVGVLGKVRVQNGVGVRGENVASFGPAIAVVGESSVGTGVQGVSHGVSGIGVSGQSDVGYGVSASSNNDTALNAVTLSGTAVRGLATSGVGGVFAAGGAGIQPGDAPLGRAGVFRADSAAQVRMVPHPPSNRTTTNQQFSVQVLISKGHETEFPANGQMGDLLCTTMLVRSPLGPPVQVGALWFCEQSGKDKTQPAHWRQVVLGPVFFGQG
jgi:hypothetical protein